MALSEQYLEEEIHPIDIVENLAAYHEWDFDRICRRTDRHGRRRPVAHLFA